MTLPLVASYTSRLGFHIRAGSDAADYQDFIDMMNKLDTTSGFGLYTEATKPTPAYEGHYILCTDTGKHYYHSGGTMTLGVYSGGSWVEDTYTTTLLLSGSQGNVIFGARGAQYGLGNTGGVTGGAGLEIAADTTVDLSTSVTFSLSATTYIKLDIDALLLGYSTTSWNNTSTPRYLTAALDANLEFHVYDGVTDLGIVAISSKATNAASTAGVPTEVHATGNRVVSLASGSHTLSVKVITRVRSQNSGGSTNVQVIEPQLTVTVSG